MKKRIAWALCALWMGVIFLMSALPGDVSGAQSGRLTALLQQLLSLLSFGKLTVHADTLHLLVRKGAHMAEYSILCILYARALRLSGAKHPILYAVALSACYAASDEFHQGFVADRGPSVVDIGIDTLGAGAGAALDRLYHVIRRDAA